MIQTKEKKKTEKIVFWICAIIIFLYAVRNVFKLSVPYILDDEFGYWSVGAWLAGYDWSGVTRWCGYYSYGYGFILAVLIKIAGRLSLAYKMAIVLNGVLLVGCLWIAKKLINELFPEISPWKAIFCAVIVVLVPNNLYHVNIAWTEVLLSFMVWLLLYLLVLYLKRNKSAYLYAMVIVGIYSYMVHNRMLATILAFLFVLCVFWQKGKITKKQFWGILLGVVAGILLSQILKVYFYNNVWKASKVAHGNSYTSLFENLVLGFSNMETLKELVINFSGKLLYFAVALLNLGWVGIYAWFVSKRKKLTEAFCIQSFIWVAFGIEILLTVLQMYGHYVQSINPLMYGRYADIFVGPVLLVIFYGIARVLCEVKKKRTILIQEISFLFHMCLAVIIAKVVEEYGLKSFGSMNSIFMQLYWDGSKLHIFQAVLVSGLIGICVYLVIMYIKKIEWQYMLGIVCIVCVTYVVSAQTAVNSSVLSYQEEQEYLKECASELVSHGSQEVYYFVNGNNVWDNRIKNHIQFLDADVRVIGQTKMEKFTDKENIIIASRNHPELLKLMFKQYKLIYQNQDVLFLGKDGEIEKGCANLGCSNFELGENATWQNYTVATNGKGGLFIETVPYELEKGMYTVKFTFRVNEKVATEKPLGMLSIMQDDKRIEKEDIWYDGEGNLVTECLFEVTEDSNIQVKFEIYDDVFLEFTEGIVCKEKN